MAPRGVKASVLSDALRDGNTIRAVIRGTGPNQDGRTPGITQWMQSRGVIRWERCL